MGESNPQILTWDGLMARLGLAGRGIAKNGSLDVLARIDAAVPDLQLGQGDYCDLRVDDERVVAAAQARASVEKFSRIPMGPHRIALAIEDLKEKVEQRIMRLSRDEATQDAMMSLSNEEQISLFGQQLAPLDDEELVSCTRQYLRARYARVLDDLDDGAWLRLDRIGMRVLDVQTLDAVEWLYLKLALVGGGERYARYVMVDEVQDYTTTQLAVLARFFPNAHFLLLGDRMRRARRIRGGVAASRGRCRR